MVKGYVKSNNLNLIRCIGQSYTGVYLLSFGNVNAHEQFPPILLADLEYLVEGIVLAVEVVSFTKDYVCFFDLVVLN